MLSIERRQFLAPVSVSREQVRLMLAGGHQVEQHDPDAERLVPRHLMPELLDAGVARASAETWFFQCRRNAR